MMPVHQYRVYAREAELVGVSEGIGDRHVVQVKKNGGIVDLTITAARLPGYLAELSRKGYVLQLQHHFFHEDLGRFTLQHPDFPEKPGANYVLFIQPSDIEEAVVAIDAIATQCGRLKSDPAFRSWIGKKLMSSDFVVADASDPRWALLLAEVAHNNTWGISPARGDLPETAPSADPTGWQEWLKNFFDISSIASAQRNLGWTVSELLSKTQSAIPAEQMLIVDYL